MLFSFPVQHASDPHHLQPLVLAKTQWSCLQKLEIVKSFCRENFTHGSVLLWNSYSRVWGTILDCCFIEILFMYLETSLLWSIKNVWLCFSQSLLLHELSAFTKYFLHLHIKFRKSIFLGATLN